MRRVGGLWPEVVSFENLRRSAGRAARGKRETATVARFLGGLEGHALELQRQLEAGTWRPGPVTHFWIHDPKKRQITVAPFRDRVVHHALIGVLEPVLERRMVAVSFACRRGKGTHAALDHAQRLVRRHGWFLKLDIRQCFASLDHSIVLGCLARTIKDRRVLELCGHIVRGGGGTGRGLPIGNLTSQWFCNLVLDRLDHFVKEGLGVRGYVRYMDDFVLFGESKAQLWRWHGRVEDFVAGELRLELKARATMLSPVEAGLPFLGWRLFRGTRRLRPENLRRMRARLGRRAWEVRRGWCSPESLIASTESIVAHLGHGATRELRRRWLVELRLPERGRSP